MSALDQSETYQRLDPSRLRSRVAGLPDQCRRAWEEASALDLPTAYAGARKVVVVGMGGSAIGGDLLAGLAEQEKAPLVHVVRGYTLPAWVGPTTLTIVSSYSGNTEETLSAYHQAVEQGALLVAMTSGGTLAQEAADSKTPLFRVSYQGEPRSALGYSFIVPLALLCKIGLLADKEAELRASVQLMEELASGLGPEVPEVQNLAKTVARAMHGRLPVVYGAGFLTGVARRWKTQLNENGKVWAFYEPLPEVNHNAVLGYALPAEKGERAYVALLHSHFLHPRVSLRYQITQDILLREGVAHRRLDGVGESPLAHILTAALLGDYVSYYVGILNQVDPALTPTLDEVKRRLTKE